MMNHILVNLSSDERVHLHQLNETISIGDSVYCEHI